MHEKWKLVKGSWLSATKVLPGVWRRKEGGHVVRGRATDPRTGRLREIWRVLPDLDAPSALKWLREESARIRTGAVDAPPSPKVPFATYAVSLLERKIERREIKSTAGKRKWGVILERLIEDPIGNLYVSEIRTGDIEAWKTRMARKIAASEYKVTTVNTWLSVLKVVMARATIDFELPRNVAVGVRSFDTSEHHTYTDEEPNALTVDELRRFLACMREKYPQHFAMTYVGFATGLRPSSLRPLRRTGSTPDVLFKEDVLLIRQSQTDGDAVMKCTKSGTTQRLTVPKELMQVLRWHVDTQLRPGLQQESELLFPSEVGGFRSRSCLDKPFHDVAKAIGLTKKITPRGMRRSFQDLARTAEVKDLVTRSISGHATEEMQRRYSTVSPREQSEGLARVLQLMDYKRRTKATPRRPSRRGGEESGEVAR